MKTGGKALLITLELNKDKIKPNEIIDTYNKSITMGGVSPCILCGVDFRNHIYVIVKDEHKTKKRL